MLRSPDFRTARRRNFEIAAIRLPEVQKLALAQEMRLGYLADLSIKHGLLLRDVAALAQLLYKHVTLRQRSRKFFTLPRDFIALKHQLLGR
jgi:hypothetical protein